MNGILVINKPKGFSSHDVVAKVRRILSMKKVGHTGTLDPDATGVLPILLGKGTKLSEFLIEHDKEYVAEMVLGVTTDTQDHTGSVLQVRPVSAGEEDVKKALNHFLGPQQQIPPMYSAIKQNGQKLYQLARKGITVERKARSIQIYNIELLSFCLPDKIKIKISCSKGTYVRTLIEDIGELLGCGAHMSSLVRVSSGPFSLEEALTLEQLQACKDDGRLLGCIKPIDSVFLSAEKVVMKNTAQKLLVNGAKVPCSFIGDNFQIEDKKEVIVYDYQNRLVGIYTVDAVKEDSPVLKLRKFLMDLQNECNLDE